MKKATVDCTWDLIVDMEHEKQIEIVVDKVPPMPPPPGTIRIIVMIEPPEVYNVAPHVLGNQNNFDYVFTHHQEVIDQCDKAVLFEFGGTWIKDYHFPEKEFSVSTLVGGKRIPGCAGHGLRHKLWAVREGITIPRKFYLSSNFAFPFADYSSNLVLPPDKKEPLFDSQFHIAIENAQRQNWFTEKLMDALQTKTIPIYWGASNISNYFNLEGMYIVNSVKDIVSVCNSLTPDTYKKKWDAIEENYNRSMEFADVGEHLKKKILSIL